MSTILKVDHVSKIFGGLKAVQDVSMHVEEGELVALIGPNGAGKTTLFNALTGVSPATEGTVAFNSNGEMVSLDKKRPYQVAKMGIARTFQNIRLFSQLSVRENLQAAMTHRYKENVFASMFRLPAFYKKEALVNGWTDDLLKRLQLQDVGDAIAGNLPYGTQRRIEIARAVASDPKLIFLDEPAAGMNPEETDELSELILRLKTEFGLTVVLIEHDMSLVMKLAERIYVLEQGKLIAEGTPAEIQADEGVINSYLGGGAHA
ncbi:ABC transporter ATP-binding protein [Lacticaseibacillus jixiensis]|uniref:ABC transporter ATP-binding protein n=1 Tax=Lacticaseibacillus jixiensis TaxID=3231926 RepID=UPI0036F26C0F